MLFSLLLDILNFAIGICAKTNKSCKDMISIRNSAYVIMTRDRKRGRRYLFRYGKYSSDKVLSDYDMALVFENADVGFKTLALGGDNGVQEAINNWTLKIWGDDMHMIWFGIIMGMAMGGMKRK